MSSVVISGNTSGTVTLAAPDVAGSTTLTLPATSGTVLTSATPFSNGQGPAFSAYLSTNQTISSGVFTKVAFNTEEFDTNSNYDSVTNYRFTPTVAGYYQFNANVQQQNTLTCTQLTAGFYKNGALFKIGNNIANSAPQGISISAIIYMNGSTDYVEVYGFNSGTGTVLFYGAQASTYFQAAMVRGA